jgi:hypothetical protein
MTTVRKKDAAGSEGDAFAINREFVGAEDVDEALVLTCVQTAPRYPFLPMPLVAALVCQFPSLTSPIKPRTCSSSCFVLQPQDYRASARGMV